MGMDKANAMMACQRVSGRIRSLIAKPIVAKRMNGKATEKVSRMEYGNCLCFQSARYSRPTPIRLAHPRTIEVVILFIGLWRHRSQLCHKDTANCERHLLRW